MRKCLLAGLVLLGMALGARAQSANYTPGRVALTPVYDESFSPGLPPEATDLLQNKLDQVVLQNGAGSFSEQYLLSARVLVDDKQVTAAAPPQYIVKLIVQLSVIDTEANVLVRELSVPVTGVDKSESRAMLAAIRRLNPRSPQVAAFVRSASDEIVQAYNRNLDNKLSAARSYADADAYDEALFLLGQIPSDVDRYDEVRALTDRVYNAYQQHQRRASAAESARRAQAAEAAAEAEQRQRDQQMQLEMIRCAEQRARQSEKSRMIEKVSRFLMGSLKA